MLMAIQHAYYLQDKNPSDIDTLHKFAIEIGLDGNDFLQQMNSQQLNKALKKEITQMSMMPMSGFPALVLLNKHVHQYSHRL
jgi:putative protein-disulfide isomerase